MNAGDLTSLFQLSVALNLGFGALISFVDPIRDETDNSSTSIERYIVDRTAKQAGKPADYLRTLNSLCRDHFRYQALLSQMTSKLRFYDALGLRIAFASLAALSLIGLIAVSAMAEVAISAWYIVVPAVFNAGPVLFAFWLCYQLSTYYDEIRPLMERCFRTIRKLETMV